MYTKSIIQQHIEKINTLNILQESLSNFMDRYTVKDGVFGLFQNKMYEITCGYLIQEQKFEKLEDAIRVMKPSQGIRVVENKEFTIGDIISNLHDCPENCNVLDIEFLEEIER